MLLFLDESGTDHKQAPYEVLAGLSISEERAWPLIQVIHASQLEHFGVRLADVLKEFKGSQLLKTKTFRLAQQMDSIPSDQRRELAISLLEKGRLSRETGVQSNVSKAELTAYAQASLAYARRVLELCDLYGVRTFASVIDPNAPRSINRKLRKDIMYLLERFHISLGNKGHGLIVFDELDVTQSKRVAAQILDYFENTSTGRRRATRILPEPFFVHSDLTTLVQVADLIAYCINWGLRFEGQMTAPVRLELRELSDLVEKIEFRTTQNKRHVRGFCFLKDLRGKKEKAMP
jgi:Protein of unknown function (DUF3800)